MQISVGINRERLNFVIEGVSTILYEKRLQEVIIRQKTVKLICS